MKEQTAKILDNAKRLHFVGIGGSGMFPIVQIMHGRGYEITGSDVNYGDIIGYEREMGIRVNIPHEASAVEGASALVVTAALLPNNPEVERAQELGIPIIKRAEILGYITALHSDAFCISGTHGKTTTSSMLTQILYCAGKDPSAVIGGKLPIIDGYGRSGEGELMVCEACEFADTFLELHPATSVILNIDRDHLEYFKTVENLERSFTKFAGLASKRILANRDDANTVTALAGTHPIWFGVDPESDFLIKNITRRSGAFYNFTLCHNGDEIDIALNTPGLHNVHNAAAAGACAVLAGCSRDDIVKALFEFSGAGRRFEVLGHIKGATVVDDYAHHPAELAVTLSAAKNMGFKRIIAVFQPFTFTRTRMLLDDFAEALRLADIVLLTPIMGSREINTTGIQSEHLAQKLDNAQCFPSFEALAKYASDIASEGDLIITLGCGDIYKCARMILKG